MASSAPDSSDLDVSVGGFCPMQSGTHLNRFCGYLGALSQDGIVSIFFYLIM